MPIFVHRFSSHEKLPDIKIQYVCFLPVTATYGEGRGGEGGEGRGGEGRGGGDQT